MTLDEVASGVNDAHHTLKKADQYTDQMARMIVGRLQRADVSGSVLADLKRELRDFNIHTNKWKEQ